MISSETMNKARVFVPSWNVIARVVDHKIWNLAFLFFVLMPVIALFMKEIPEQVSVKINEKDYVLHLELPFKWWVLYFSALFISIAKGVYLAFSPAFIKDFQDYDDFIKSGRSGGFLQKTLYELIPFWKRKNSSSLDDYVGKFDERIHFLNKSGVNMALGSELWGSEIKQSFWLVYDICNFSRVIPRLISVLFIGLAALAFAYIMIDKILLVLAII
ncbi:hypothetical protein DZF79_30785 [Vibrio parahaemolyticus]|uniref:hypothetical protein n=1 Tax=Vibrio parahaemolyticus TaxID=670 RepID=UPI001D48C802|nr:hypothetical protein [Vibrio parahaemolyticus]EGR2232558.1 hypothetical protein [Vibrio parahaemolyticus]HCD1298710.1 hypothetical protein [Vibrio parahaemolyticus]HCE2002307.1 hypothetical protein [Vibrio parahaemolyticus]HCG6738991.1 hypothetical protein [Vibrio parahaemolyticus]